MNSIIQQHKEKIRPGDKWAALTHGNGLYSYDVEPIQTVNDWVVSAADNHIEYFEGINENWQQTLTRITRDEAGNITNGKPQTYCESVGLKAGDRIRVLEDGKVGIINAGDIFTLTEDRGDSRPLMKSIGGASFGFSLDQWKWERVTDKPALPPFPDHDFKIRGGDRPEVREWLAANGCDWGGCGNIETRHLEQKLLFIESGKTWHCSGDIVRFDDSELPEFIFPDPANPAPAKAEINQPVKPADSMRNTMERDQKRLAEIAERRDNMREIAARDERKMSDAELGFAMTTRYLKPVTPEPEPLTFPAAAMQEPASHERLLGAAHYGVLK